MGNRRKSKRRSERAAKQLFEMLRHWSPRNKERFDEISKQSRSEFWWKCPRGHEFKDKMAAIRSRPKPLCPVCRAQHNKLKDRLKET